MVKSCFLIGHRETSEGILPALMEAVERHIADFGVSEYVVGNYGGFDGMAARAVIAAKENHRDITLLLQIPFHPAERPVELPPGFDGSFYPPAWKQFPGVLQLSGQTDIWLIIPTSLSPECGIPEIPGIFWRMQKRGKKRFFCLLRF